VDTTISPPVRIAAVCGLVAAVVIGGGLMMLGRHSSSATPPPAVIKHHTVQRPVVKTHTPAKTRASATSTHVVAKKAPVVHVPKPAPRPTAELAALAAGLPASLAHALGQHAVVVVELFDPQSETDGIAFAEAQAGAQAAHAGFLPISVLGTDVSKLTQKFGQVLPDPGLLVYTRPAMLAVRIDGFVDKDTVAQAAMNAARGT
jgi:hypothetical protein